MAMRLTLRDREILHALTHCVRLFSIQQIFRSWWNKSSDNSTAVRDRIRTLSSDGWISRATVFVRPLPSIQKPLFAWKPKQPAPSCHALAWKSQSRWNQAAESTAVIVASNKASRHFFGKNARGLRQGFQTAHDLGVAEVYLQFRRDRPELLPLWRGERTIAPLRRRRKVPDAVIADETLWPPQFIVEFAGAYSAERIEQFHRFCVKESLAYELW